MIKDSDIDIEPGVGMGGASFGMTLEELELLLGKADETEEYPDLDSTAIYYKGFGAFFFDRQSFSKLDSMEIKVTEGVRVAGFPLHGKKMADLKEHFKSHSFEIERITDDDGNVETSFEVDELGLIIYLGQDGIVSTLSIAVLYDDDDQPIWPERA